MLELEELHGIEVGTDYRSDHEGAIFADLIDLTTAAALKLKVDDINLIVALADGSTDAAIIDQEALFVRYLNTDPPGRDQVMISTNFLRLKMYQPMKKV